MNEFNVLLVEDESSQILLVTTALTGTERYGLRFYVHPETTLAGALDALGSIRFDAIILDLMLPDANDLMALHALRHEVPEVPIVVLSAISEPELSLRAMSEGADECLMKTQTSYPRLFLHVRYAIARAEAVRDLVGELRRAHEESGRLRDMIEQMNSRLGEVSDGS